ARGAAIRWCAAVRDAVRGARRTPAEQHQRDARLRHPFLRCRSSAARQAGRDGGDVQRRAQPAERREGGGSGRVMSEGIAIVGMACTYPGARNVSRFWENILNKVDAVTDVTPDRWDPDVFYDPDPAAEDRIYCKKGGWIGGSFAFNPLKYGIMPSTLDGAEPDHFLVLRAVDEALADAGYGNAPDKTTKTIDGSRVSVIVGKGNYLGP